MTASVTPPLYALALSCALVGQEPPPPGQAVDPAPVLDTTTFRDHWNHIVPSDDELRWRAIPWRSTLGEAVVQAHASDKPILLWAMNGHPLACT